jgi:hypothetical protein
MSNVKIEVVDTSNNLIIEETPFVIELGTSGPQGPIQVVSYAFTQTTPSSTWTIVHGLDFVPNITVVDSAGTVVEGDYSYPNENTVIATFIGAFAGKAYLS